MYHMSGRCIVCTEGNVYVEDGQTGCVQGRSRARCVHGKGVHLMCTGGEVEPDVFMGRGYM